MGGELHKIISWSFWTANLLVDAVYVCMAWATATNLANASGNLHTETWKDAQSTVRSFVSNNIWRAPIAACALGGLMVVLFNLMSCIVLLRKSIAKKAGAGFGYGFVVGWCFAMAFFTLMCGLVMQGFTSTVEGQLTAESGWTSMMTGAFKATYVFGYIVACMFVIFFLVLVAAPSEFVDQQLLQRKRQLEMNTLSAAGGGGMPTLQAAAIQWPEIFKTPEAEAAKPELVEKMRKVRPVVETGYENIVQIRALYEGVSVQDMLDTWHKLLPRKMKEWSLDRQELVNLFGSVRDKWIAEDLSGWLAPNRIYPGVADAVRSTLSSNDTEVYVVTTKQAHYTEVLLRDMAKVPFPAGRIHSTTVSAEPKASVLARLADEHPGAERYIFVEDKFGTLAKVAADPKTQDWQLYLVDWGYNTLQEQMAAAAHPKITVINVESFAKLLHA